jgi:hypothetical protein
MKNFEQTIISQYGNSSTIGELIQHMNQYFDPYANFDAFYDFVWNVDTAQGFGLDIWGRIVNISRRLTFAAVPIYFGFSQGLPGSYPFNQAPFYSGTPAASQTYVLTDDVYRQLILMKALANISTTTAPALNQLLQNFFVGRGPCCVLDLGGMAIQYTFMFTLTDYEYAIMTQNGIFPRPAGVSATVLQNASSL